MSHKLCSNTGVQSVGDGQQDVGNPIPHFTDRLLYLCHSGKPLSLREELQDPPSHVLKNLCKYWQKV